jgi:hypothetical protein
MQVYLCIFCWFIEAFYAGLYRYFMPIRIGCRGVSIKPSYAGLFKPFMPVYLCILCRFIVAFYAGPELVAVQYWLHVGVFYAGLLKHYMPEYAGILCRSGIGFRCRSNLAFMPEYTGMLCQFIHAFYASLFKHLCWNIQAFMPEYFGILCRFIYAFYAGLFKHYKPEYTGILCRSGINCRNHPYRLLSYAGYHPVE